METGARRRGQTAGISPSSTPRRSADLARLKSWSRASGGKATTASPTRSTSSGNRSKKGFTYRTGDGIYFDTAPIPGIRQALEPNSMRCKRGPGRKKPGRSAQRHGLRPYGVFTARRRAPEEWTRPGRRVPRWHIECSAMEHEFSASSSTSTAAGSTTSTSITPTEIAQSEAATGRKFFNFWMHGAFLNIQGGKKMAQDEDNFLTLENALIQRGIPPLAYRFAPSYPLRKPMGTATSRSRPPRTAWSIFCNQVRKCPRRRSVGRRPPIPPSARNSWRRSTTT